MEAAGATVAALTEATLFAEPDAPGARERANLVAELGDLLSFVDDAAGLPEANGESLAEAEDKKRNERRRVRGEKLVCSERRSTAVVKRSSVHRQHSSLTSRSRPATW
mgnify:CR=1 FL=1